MSIARSLSPFPSRTIALYTARMFIIRTFAVLTMLVLVLQTLDMLGESGNILAHPGNGQAELWTYIGLRLPQLISRFLPFAVLLGTLITLVQLNQNSEVVIFKSAGISAHQRSEEHTSELQSLMRISYAVFCLKKKKNRPTT